MHDFHDEPDEDFAMEAMAMAEQMVRAATYFCLEEVELPSTMQLVAVQAFFPNVEAMELRKQMIAGHVRIGPFLPGPVLDFAQASLRGAGLSWHLEPPNAQDLAKLGMTVR
jgi:hypothetical protein